MDSFCVCDSVFMCICINYSCMSIFMCVCIYFRFILEKKNSSVEESNERDDDDDESKDPEEGEGTEEPVPYWPATGLNEEKTGRNYWNWVVECDELTLAMEDGAVFSGFIEAPITFPPSFKWRVGGHAGDFKDLATLSGSCPQLFQDVIMFAGTLKK